MIRIFPNEQWKEFPVENKPNKRYAVSNFGRLMTFTDTFEEGTMLRGGTNNGYRTFTYTFKLGNKRANRYFYIRRLVAENFIPKTSADQVYVLLLDSNRNNNFVGNLKWATREEMLEHRKISPFIIDGFKNRARRQDGYKLNSTQVILIKKKLLNPNRKTRMKILAKQFGVSEMQLYRIKSGENWGNITID